MNKYPQLALLACAFAVLVSLPFARAEAKAGGLPAIPTVRLNNGMEMPTLGFGTLYLKDDVGASCVAQAIKLGYRLLDTATIYGNEDAVGRGIKQSGIDRKELFISTKLWVSDMGYEGTKKALQTSLEKLGVEYVDLYLIHRPHGDVAGSWRAMEELCRAGKIRAIGVSNFDPAQLADLIAKAEIKPVVNQIELNPYFQQPELAALIAQAGVQVEAWSPFAEGRNGLFTDATLVEIGRKHHKTAAQVTLRWLIQRGVAVIPRSSNPAHMQENLDVFDFELNEAEMRQIAALDKKTSQFPEWK